MNRQLVFNKVYNHLLNQNRKAQDDTRNCKYRFEGLKCAIGCLIPDSDYDPLMDDLDELKFEFGDDASTKITQNPPALKVLEKYYGNLSDEDIYFLVSLQNIHDFYYVTDWNGKLRAFACHNSLNIPSLL